MTKRLQISLKDEVKDLLERLADDLSVSKSTVITLALKKYEEDRQKEKREK